MSTGKTIHLIFSILFLLIAIVLTVDLTEAWQDPARYRFSIHSPDWNRQSLQNYLLSGAAGMLLWYTASIIGFLSVRFYRIPAWRIFFRILILGFFALVLIGFLKWQASGFDH